MFLAFSRLVKIVFLAMLFSVLVQGSVSSTNADSFNVSKANGWLNEMTYARVGPGRYEAECATMTGTWTFRKANRASKGSHGCIALKNANYIESSSTANTVCIEFKKADRVGVGYVAGNDKGKAKVSLYNSSGVLLSTKTLNIYDSYSYDESSPGVQRNDTDNEIKVEHLAPDAGATFWAFRWIWTCSIVPSSGKMCVAPKGTGTQGTAVSLDYFVIGKGTKMAQRGFARSHNYMTLAETGATWNLNSCGEDFADPEGCTEMTNLAEFLPATGSDAWKGFIPKIPDPSNWEADSSRADFITDVVYPVIQGARDYAGGVDTYVPQYWILFNVPDMANFFFYYDDGYRASLGPYPQPYPEDPKYLHGFVNVISAIQQGYANQGLVAPKIILETGSQTHAPGNSAANHWALEYCPEQVNGGNPWLDRNGNPYWGCTHPNDVWITEFWDALKTDMTANPGAYPLSLTDVKAAIGGFGGHYYTGADPNCQATECYLNPTRVVAFVSALKAWMASEFAGREVWLVETATHLNTNTGCTNVNFNQLGLSEQRDLFPCQQANGTFRYYNVRNYIGRLQEVLAEAGVHRWAWYAERYGGANPCADGSGGEMTALNASCNSYVESPFGNNFSLAAPYR